VNSGDAGGGSHIANVTVSNTQHMSLSHSCKQTLNKVHIKCNTYTSVQYFTEHTVWRLGGNRNQTTTQKPNPNHSKTMIQFTEQRPYSVSDSSCCWEAWAQQPLRELVWYWSWKTERREGEKQLPGGVFAFAFYDSKAGYKAVQVCSVPRHT